MTDPPRPTGHVDGPHLSRGPVGSDEGAVRQLTAIMFTDMVGYTAIMQVDERRAREQRQRQWSVLQEEIDNHGGRLLQAYGDGTLSVFQSAIAAVRCAVAIQRALGADPRVPLRIGVHTGDIVHDHGGVFGDGVNVAARVQSLAAPGSVLVSEKVFDEIKNQPDLEARSLGSFRLKNVQRPLEVHAMVGEGLAIPPESQLAGHRGADLRSIAVLPFVNMSADPENEYFSDGITEEIINALTRIQGLQVTARTSSFAFKGHREDVRTIAARLGVGTVLEGSVRKAGARVRITAQLICAADGYHLFSEVYDRSLEGIFETQDEISRTIVERLSEHLQPARAVPTPPSSGSHHGPTPRPERIVPAHTHDTEAYTEYLKGRYHWNKWTPTDARKAIDHLERSAEMDPTCSLPFSALAAAYTFMGSIGHLPAEDAYPRAAAFARQALDLEADAGESHLALAAVQLFYDWDFEGAGRSFAKALELTPGSAEAHHIHALYLKAVGRLDEAVASMETAVRLDPLSLPLNQTLGVALFAAGRIDDAERQLRRSLELDPEFRASVEMLGWVQLRRGRIDEAIRLWDRLPGLAGTRWAGAGIRAFAYARAGDLERAHQLLDVLRERQKAEPMVNLRMDFALAHHGMGDADVAFEHLEAAVRERLGSVIFLATSPNWTDLRDDPRFDALVRRIGIPVPRRAS